VRPEGFGKLEKIHLIGTRSRDLPVCSLVPQPLRYRESPYGWFDCLFNDTVRNSDYIASNKIWN
jgi:hypothetical protein